MLAGCITLTFVPGAPALAKAKAGGAGLSCGFMGKGVPVALDEMGVKFNDFQLYILYSSVCFCLVDQYLAIGYLADCVTLTLHLGAPARAKAKAGGARVVL